MMGRTIGIILVAGLALMPIEAVAESAAPSREEAIATLVEEFGPRMLASRYMEKNCQRVEWPGYEGLPTLMCEYNVVDRKTSTSKSAPVVMLNAPPEMVSTWIVDAYAETSGPLVMDDLRKFFRVNVIGQSGGQFPVAGVVYEDMEGDGGFKAYCFRDGVTVRVEGVEHRTTAPLSQEEREASLRGQVERVYTYARIASTSPDEYKAAVDKADVGNDKERKPEWLEVVRKAYIEAWKTGRNSLFVAKMKGMR